MLAKKTAIVTGGSQGIGAAIVEKLLLVGFAVVFGYKENTAAANELVERFSLKGLFVKAVQGDITNPETQAALIENARNFGPISALVNNAGQYSISPAEKLAEVDFRRLFEINLFTPLALTSCALKHLEETAGVIVNISSINSKFPKANTTIYSASKAALDAATKSLAAELGPKGIRVNSIAPGPVKTKLLESCADDHAISYMKSLTPLGNKLASPEDIANVVAFLCHEDAKWITGQVITVDGGLTL